MYSKRPRSDFGESDIWSNLCKDVKRTKKIKEFTATLSTGAVAASQLSEHGAVPAQEVDKESREVLTTQPKSVPKEGDEIPLVWHRQVVVSQLAKVVLCNYRRMSG